MCMQMQRYIVQEYMLPDVEFVHPFASVRGRENFYKVTSAQKLDAWTYQPQYDLFWPTMQPNLVSPMLAGVPLCLQCSGLQHHCP